MGIATGLTAARMLEIEESSVTAGFVDVNGNLLLQTRGGTEIDAGFIRGPQGVQGEQGIPGPQGDPADLPGRLGLLGQIVNDWNLAINPGFYFSSGAALNNPVGNVACGQVTVVGDPAFTRVIQEVYFASDSPANFRQTWRRTGFLSTGTWSAWSRLGQVPSHFKFPNAPSTGGTGTATIASDHTALVGCYTVRLTDLFLGDGDDGDGFAVYEFFWQVVNSPAAAVNSTFFIGLAGTAVTRSGLRSVYTYQSTTTPTPVYSGSAADTAAPKIFPDSTAANTGMTVHGFVYHAHSSAERTRIEYNIVSDRDNGARAHGIVHNTAIAVDDGIRLGSSDASRTWDGRFYCKRVQ